MRIKKDVDRRSSCVGFAVQGCRRVSGLTSICGIHLEPDSPYEMWALLTIKRWGPAVGGRRPVPEDGMGMSSMGGGAPLSVYL